MDRFLPIRKVLSEELRLSEQRNHEIAQKVASNIKRGDTTDAALSKAMTAPEQDALSSRSRDKILFKIDLCLSLLEIDPIPKPSKVKSKIEAA